MDPLPTGIRNLIPVAAGQNSLDPDSHKGPHCRGSSRWFHSPETVSGSWTLGFSKPRVPANVWDLRDDPDSREMASRLKMSFR